MRRNSLPYMITAAVFAVGLLFGRQDGPSQEIRIPAGGEWDDERIFDLLEQLGALQLEKLDVTQRKGDNGKTSLEIVAKGVQATPDMPSQTCAQHPVYLRLLPFADQAVALVLLQQGTKEPSKGKVRKLAESCRGSLPAGSVFRFDMPVRATLYQDGKKTARLYWLKLHMQLRRPYFDLPRKIGRPPN